MASMYFSSDDVKVYCISCVTIYLMFIAFISLRGANALMILVITFWRELNYLVLIYGANGRLFS